MGSGPGSLVFTALLWPKVAAAAKKKRAFVEATEGEILSPEADFLGSLSHVEPSPKYPVCICVPLFNALKICFKD